MHNIFQWDSCSDQPYILKKEDKKFLRKGYTLDLLKLLGTNLILYPYLFLKFLMKKKSVTSVADAKSFYGLCVNLDKGDSQHDLVEELGVRSLQIRVFLKDMQHIDDYVDFARKFGSDKEILITVIQDRAHIEDHDLLKKDMTTIFEKFQDISHEFQIGNAVNRIKWSFISMEEYVSFYETVQRVRDENFPKLKLIGPAVIDFEYHYTIRTLFNSFNVHYDKVSSLLYVDRRGSPTNSQMVLFDLQNKIEFLDTIVKSSAKAEDLIYLTEVNWPISGTSPYAPTSEKECVSESLYEKYMLDYFEIAKKTGKVEKVFWHQLIAAGYGLIDDREGKMQKRDAFYAFKRMIEKGSDE